MSNINMYICQGQQQKSVGRKEEYDSTKYVAQMVNNPPANAGDIKDVGSIPGSGRSLGGGHGNTL